MDRRSFLTATLLLAVPACGYLEGPAGNLPCDEASIEYVVMFGGGTDKLVDPAARPTVTGLMHVGGTALNTVLSRSLTGCNRVPSIVWHQTNPDVATLAGGLVTARSPGVTQVTATVMLGARTSEATLFWCQRSPTGAPDLFSVDQCTWIPMSGIQVVP
jgi:hypothetical protein